MSSFIKNLIIPEAVMFLKSASICAKKKKRSCYYTML